MRISNEKSKGEYHRRKTKEKIEEENQKKNPMENSNGEYIRRSLNKKSKENTKGETK